MDAGDTGRVAGGSAPAGDLAAPGGDAPARSAPPRVRGEQRLAEFALESGAVLEDVRQAWVLDGALNAARDNLVLVLHALTGTPEAAGEAGWWRDVIGPGRAVDTGRWAVLVPNLLGSCYGTTGPSTAWRVRGEARAPDPAHDVRGGFPAVTPRDMARLAGRLIDALGVRQVALVAGGSLGGMVAQEWALAHPGRARALVSLAAPAAHTAQAIGWNHVQRLALDLGARAGDAAAGVAIARALGMLTFRTEASLEGRFGRQPALPETGDRAPGAGAPFAVQAWLDRHGERLNARFDARSYATLLDAMDAHDVGRGRGGRAAALAALGRAVERLVAVGVPGDLLYSAEVVREWAHGAGAVYREVRSVHGHDAFLLEGAQVGAILREALEEGGTAESAPPREGQTLAAAAA